MQQSILSITRTFLIITLGLLLWSCTSEPPTQAIEEEEIEATVQIPANRMFNALPPGSHPMIRRKLHVGPTPIKTKGIQAGSCTLTWDQGTTSRRHDRATHYVDVTPETGCTPDYYVWDFENHSGGWSTFNNCTNDSCGDDPFNGANGGYNIFVTAYDNNDVYLGDTVVDHHVTLYEDYTDPQRSGTGGTARVDAHSEEQGQYCDEVYYGDDYSNVTTDSRSKWDERADYDNGSWLIWDDYHNGSYIDDIDCESPPPS